MTLPNVEKAEKPQKAKKANRRGVMIGCYVPPHVKEFLERRAAARYTSLSQVLKEILLREIDGAKQLDEKPKGERFG